MQIHHANSGFRMLGALGVVLAMAALQGYLSWQFVTVAGDKLGVQSMGIISLVGGVGFVLTVAVILLTWVLICGSLHTGALVLGGIGSFRGLLEEVGYGFAILLGAAVIATILWWSVISPAVVMTGQTLGVVNSGAVKTVAIMTAIQQSAYLLFGARLVQLVAKHYNLSGWKSALVVLAPVVLVMGLRFAYKM